MADPEEKTAQAEARGDELVGYLPAYELQRLRSGHDANLRTPKFGPSHIDGDIPVYTRPVPAVPQAGEDESAPIDMVLHCPACGQQHIDGPEGQFYPGHTAEESDYVNKYHGLWANPPHRSHLCHGCGNIWRPADIPTNGVPAVKTRGKKDSNLASQPMSRERCHADRDGDCRHADCPQLRDGEPRATGRHCPLDVSDSAHGIGTDKEDL